MGWAEDSPFRQEAEEVGADRVLEGFDQAMVVFGASVSVGGLIHIGFLGSCFEGRKFGESACIDG